MSTAYSGIVQLGRRSLEFPVAEDNAFFIIYSKFRFSINTEKQ